MERRLADELPCEIEARYALARLIQKLRWIGMEHEARRVEFMLAEVPSGKRSSVLNDPLSTD
jgi:hypothetical protein